MRVYARRAQMVATEEAITFTTILLTVCVSRHDTLGKTFTRAWSHAEPSIIGQRERERERERES